MKKIIVVLGLSIYSVTGLAQNWAEHIAPIIYSNCVSCHRPEGIAPFSLLTYTDAFNYWASIRTAVSSGHMPPWPPADSYVHFTGARTLSSTQVSAIVNWVNNNAPSGNLSNAPPPPPPVSNALGTPDIQLKMPVYTPPASTSDIYQCFVLPLRLPAQKYVSAVEVIPGNSSIVHHVLVFQDTTSHHAAQLLDDASPGPGYTNFGGIGVNSALLLDAWVPGQTIKKLPVIFGKKIFPNSDIVIQVHYPAGSTGKLDSTKVRLYYNSNTTAREVQIQPVLNHYPPSLVNFPLSIPANTIKTFEERFTLPTVFKASVLAVAPHMHLIGESIKSFAIKPNGDTIRFIDIPHWDFHWQGQYYFQKPVVVEGGSTIRAFATYNNTVTNPKNPYNPPRTINLGEATTDEMMLVYFAFTQYQSGDEQIIIDSSLLTSTPVDPSVSLKKLAIFPNPTRETLQFLNPEPHSGSTLVVWDMTGRKMYEGKTQHETLVRIPTERWANGMYRVYLKTEKGVYYGTVQVLHP